MYHMFDIEVAKQVGIIAAVLFQNIAYWCQHSQANGTNYHDGYFWTYNTVKAFKTIFPYLSSSQIDTGIKKLVDAGLIIKGNYNKSAYDRTTWYAITNYGKSIFEKSKMEIAEIENGFPPNRKPIPNINSDVNAIDKPDNSISSIDDDFSKFWAAYPRKDGKQDAIKAWKSLKPNSDLQRVILDDIRRRMESGGAWYKTEKRFIKMAGAYLRGRRWEDEGGVTEVAEHREPDPVQLTAEEERIIADIYASGGGWG